jgi:hypothetical protein
MTYQTKSNFQQINFLNNTCVNLTSAYIRLLPLKHYIVYSTRAVTTN